MKHVASLVAFVALFGCGNSTEVLVVTDSDMVVPGQIDSLETVVSSPSGGMQRSTADLVERPLPRTLSLVHESGELGPFDVSVSGRLGGSVIVSRQAELTFIPGQTRVLVMHLVDACRTMGCGGRQTCTERGCQRVDAPLEEWTGTVPTLGGGPGDAGVPQPDTGSMCGGPETDCGGVCVNTNTSRDHCGRCNNRCPGMQRCDEAVCARP